MMHWSKMKPSKFYYIVDFDGNDFFNAKIIFTQFLFSHCGHSRFLNPDPESIEKIELRKLDNVFKNKKDAFGFIKQKLRLLQNETN